jgi:hypothetical protein
MDAITGGEASERCVTSCVRSSDCAVVSAVAAHTPLEGTRCEGVAMPQAACTDAIDLARQAAQLATVAVSSSTHS